MIKKFAKGLAVGSLVGGALGLLLAPRSGKATRQKLVDEVDEATNLTLDLNDSLQNFQDSLGTLKATASQLLPAFKAETQQSLETFKFQAEPRIAEINKTVAKINQQLEED